MSIAVAAWYGYLIVHFALAPGWFGWRYRRLPYVLKWWPRNGYDFIESAYGLLVIGYTFAVSIGHFTEPHWIILPLICIVVGSGLILWSVVTLGRNWRIGQDASDNSCIHVTNGPYRFLRHPIYCGMTISALGQTLLSNCDLSGMILAGGTVAYVFFQSRAESRRWSNRGRAAA